MKHRNKVKWISLMLLFFIPMMAMGGAVRAEEAGGAAKAAATTYEIVVHKYILPEGTEAGPVGDGTEDAMISLGAKIGVNVPYTLEYMGELDAKVDVNALSAGDYKATDTTGEDGSVTFVLPQQGIYRLTEGVSDQTEVPAAPFLVAVPMTNPAGDGKLNTVHVYPKSTVPAEASLDCYVQNVPNKHHTAGLGETHTWINVATLPPHLYLTEGQEFTITNTISPLLAYRGGTAVQGINADNQAIDLKRNTDYALTEPAGGSPDLSLSLRPSGRAELQNNKCVKLRVAFQAAIRTDLDTAALAQGIRNSAVLVFKDSGLTLHEYTDNDMPEVHTGGLRLFKAPATKPSQPLSGATFKIADSEANARAGKYLKDPQKPDQDWSVTTGADGRAFFKGLAYGTKGAEQDEGNIGNAATEPNAGATDYWLVETKAPQTYELPTEPIKVTVSSTSHLEEQAVTVLNKRPGFTLPNTGSPAALAFELIGAAIIVSGVLMLLLARARKKKGR